MEVGCTKSVKNICIVGVHQKELFLQGHAKTQLILAMHFVNMKGRKNICLEKNEWIWLSRNDRRVSRIKSTKYKLAVRKYVIFK